MNPTDGQSGYALIGYPGSTEGNYPLYECSECGAAVSAPGTHDRWHSTTTPRPGQQFHPKEV